MVRTRGEAIPRIDGCGAGRKKARHMGLRCGIIGLPNAGKSTLFSALTSTRVAVGNYPFTTIEPNLGVAEVPDKRLRTIGALYTRKKQVPATVEFLDIAGLVQGASRGEGLGNRFLSHIRTVDSLIHVVRCFQNDQVDHPSGKLDPFHDVEIIRTELALADLETLQKHIQKHERTVKSGDPAAGRSLELARRLSCALDETGHLHSLPLTPEEQDCVRNEFQILSGKPVLYVLNVTEENLQSASDVWKELRDRLALDRSEWVMICARIEAELLELESAERQGFLDQMGLDESGLAHLVRTAYRLLGLVTFFTVGDAEVRAWTVPQATAASQAAGKVHADMEKGFIRAEVMSTQELLSCGSIAAVRDQGKLRLEGRDYQIQDGDVVFFRFHV